MVNFFKKHREVLAYLVFGGLTTLLNIVLYTLFSGLFGYEAANSWGNVLDNLLCILFAYLTNRAFVFASRPKQMQGALCCLSPCGAPCPGQTNSPLRSADHS